MASKVGVTSAVWGKWENGEHLPQGPNLRMLMEKLGRTLCASQLLWYFQFTRDECEPYFLLTELAASQNAAPEGK
jgi:transcriptional regulator with XRE-family HTH domain